ncbi:hypothetical protein, partial [Microbacterium hominis]|uniref:hypothetical protein n=1 Tax=Microbacterium hominis TaxID=162426 RepID=UPI001E446AE2
FPVNTTARAGPADGGTCGGAVVVSASATIVEGMSMNADDAHARREDLLSALEVIEEQPLAERATAYAALHDDLARRLESGPRDGAQ